MFTPFKAIVAGALTFALLGLLSIARGELNQAPEGTDPFRRDGRWRH
jgi:hypothetical protein